MKGSLFSTIIATAFLLPASLATPVPDGNLAPRADAPAKCTWSSGCTTTIPNAVSYCNRWSLTCKVACKSGYEYNSNGDCVVRARRCSLTSDCAGTSLPANANAYCNQSQGQCGFSERQNSAGGLPETDLSSLTQDAGRILCSQETARAAMLLRPPPRLLQPNK